MQSQILNNPRRWLRCLGIMPFSGAAWPRHRFIDTTNVRLLCHIFNIFYVMLPQVAYVTLYTIDVQALIQTFYTVVASLGMEMQLLVMTKRRNEIQHLLADMQRFIGATSASNAETAERFRRTEATVTLCCRIYERLVFGTYVCYVTMPAVLHVLHVTHTTTQSDNVGFFNDLYFFNVSNKPMRQLCYITMMFCVSSATVIILSVDLLYCGLCLYLVAMYMELQHMLRHMDTHRRTLRCSLIECVQFHQEIIRYTDTINHIFGHIIFVQFGYSLFAICGMIFAASNTTSSAMVSTVVATFSFVIELYLFCWLGEHVLTETNNLHDTVYDVHWYEFAVAEQRAIKMMLMRAQKRSGLAAYNYFQCNLETFFQIMSNVYTLLTFLQSVI